jgi:hypothetical protein
MEINHYLANGFDKVIKGLAVSCLAAYVVSTLQLNIIPENLLLPLVLLVGVIGVITLVNIHYKYSFQAREIVYYKAGIDLLAFSFLLLTVMLSVQQSTLRVIEHLNEKPTTNIFRIVNSVQLGMDVAFDIFYSIGIMLTSFGFVVAEPKSVTGWYGIFISLALLVMNLISFPAPPGESGFFDLGIFTLIWWFLLIRIIHKTKISCQKHQAN